MLSEEEKKAIEFLQEFKPKIFWEEPFKVEKLYVMKDDINLKNKIETILNLINRLQNKNEEKDKIIKLFEHECIKFKAFCRRLRKYGHDIDLFNQGQEYKCNQFLNLINGESYWDFAGKYFDETNEEIQNCEAISIKESD